MTINVAHRRLFEVDLQPVAGARFQPTGFPDIGAARFTRPGGNGDGAGTECLIVESAQSMANRLEEAGWDDGELEPVPTLAGLPDIRVIAQDDGRYITSSRTEAHRLASAFVKDSTIDGRDAKEVIRDRLGLRDDTPIAPREIARALMALDPLCLVHGVFFADKAWPGQPRIARAVTGFIDAINIREAVSGGVKRDEVRHALRDGGGTAEGYGFVPYHRMEYTAERIVACFTIDRAQIGAYGLREPAARLLETIALWEIASLLEGGLRLRTACDLVPTSDEIVDRNGTPLPSAEQLGQDIGKLIAECRDLLGGGTSIEAVWNGGKKKKKGA